MLKPAPDKGLNMVPLEQQKCRQPAVYAVLIDFYDTVVQGDLQINYADCCCSKCNTARRFLFSNPSGRLAIRVYWLFVGVCRRQSPTLHPSGKNLLEATLLLFPKEYTGKGYSIQQVQVLPGIPT
jgi:hypothetical protein